MGSSCPYRSRAAIDLEKSLSAFAHVFFIFEFLFRVHVELCDERFWRSYVAEGLYIVSTP